MSGSLTILEGEWRKDAARLSSSAAPAIFADILARHAEPQRHYHGQSHLVALTALMSQHAAHIPPGSPPRLAIWWHDAIYNPQARDNEERSADLARQHLIQLKADPAIIDQTCSLILITKNHWDGPGAADGDYFLDADIAILGAPPEIYDTYAANVRQEYAFASDDLYRAGRSGFLKSALARPRLFRTGVFETAYAAQARANMQRELASLS